jgi:ketosteroid isomerase-like protein
MTETNSDTEGLAVARALEGVIVRGKRNLLADTSIPGIEGASAALETFYYAFNTRSVDLLRKIWADDDLAQLETPIAGHLRGIASIAAIYDSMASSMPKIETVLDDIVMYFTPGLAVFTQRERATSTQNSKQNAPPEELTGRSICIFRFMTGQGGWRLIYHQIFLDNPGPPREASVRVTG